MKKYAAIALVVLMSYLSYSCSSDDDAGQKVSNYRYEVGAPFPLRCGFNIPRPS